MRRIGRPEFWFASVLIPSSSLELEKIRVAELAQDAAALKVCTAGAIAGRLTCEPGMFVPLITSEPARRRAHMYSIVFSTWPRRFVAARLILRSARALNSP